MDSQYTSVPPILNGFLEPEEWTQAAIVSFDGSDRIPPGVFGLDSAIGGPDGNGLQPPDDSSVTVYIMNDANYLYVTIDARDDILDFSNESPWLNDSAEICVDGDFSRLPQTEVNAMGYNAIIRGDGGATLTFPTDSDIRYAAQQKPNGDGWVIEFQAEITGFQRQIGFDIAINDSDLPNNPLRDSQYRWNAPFDTSWYDETQWSVVNLAEE